MNGKVAVGSLGSRDVSRTSLSDNALGLEGVKNAKV